MKPKLIQKYLQEKQARLLWECCSSCGVTSNALPPCCEQSRWHPPPVHAGPKSSHNGFSWGYLYTPDHHPVLVTAGTTGSFQRCPQQLPRLWKWSHHLAVVSHSSFEARVPHSASLPLLPWQHKAALCIGRDKKFTGLQLFLLRAVKPILDFLVDRKTRARRAHQQF